MAEQNNDNNTNSDNNPSFTNKKVLINPKALLIEDFVFNDVNNLSNLLTQLVNHYRLLVGSAEEFNRISFSTKDDVEDAVMRADELGDLIDDVVQVIGIKTRRYLRLVSRKDVLRILLREEVDALERVRTKPASRDTSGTADFEVELNQQIDEEFQDDFEDDM